MNYKLAICFIVNFVSMLSYVEANADQFLTTENDLYNNHSYLAKKDGRNDSTHPFHQTENYINDNYWINIGIQALCSECFFRCDRLLSNSLEQIRLPTYEADITPFDLNAYSISNLWCQFCRHLCENRFILDNEPKAAVFLKNEKSELENNIRNISIKGEETNSLIKFSGFLKCEIFYDSRQTVNAREGLVVLYPENVLFDSRQNDVNAVHSINMLSIHSRLKSEILGPTILKAKTSGFIEADFYGNENKNFSDLNGLRLFNAYMKFNWETTELLAGQYWHPMSVPEYFPSVVSFNAGAPFHPVSRNPQIRVKQALGGLKLIGSLFSQRDFASTGPEGGSSQYLRNSGVPNIHFQMQYEKDSSNVSGGIGIDYKIIVPELFTATDKGEIYRTSTSLKSLSWVGFIKARTKHISLKAQGVYAQNAFDVLMVGGYAVKEIVNAQTGGKEFSNLNTASVWVDIESTAKRIKGGLFCGYTKNLGSRELLEGPFYSRGMDIGSVWRISPRIIYAIGSLGVSLEGEYTTADFGTANGDGRGGVTDRASVSNFRFLLSLKYTF